MNRQISRPANLPHAGHHEHADRHEHQAGQHRRPAPDAIGHGAQDERAQGHAEQLHREHDTECGAIDAPFGGDSRGGEADRQHVESIECREPHRDGHRQ